MALSIGQILIELALNNTAFSKGLSTVSIESKRTAKEISEAFAGIGGTLSGLLGQFGPLGNAIGQAFSSAAGSASKATSIFSGMGGTVGLLGASLGAVAGLSVAAGSAALGLAVHASESAARLHEQSEATGVSVETLSRYGYIARQTGVDSETMTKGLERLSKSAYAAATAPEGTVNVYTRLGIAVKDSSGAMRPVSDILSDISDKFEKLGPGTERTALAMQLFGRGGAAMLPALAEGSAGLQKMGEEADAFGVTISGQTAAAAHKFQQSLDQIKEAGSGVENQLMIQLLPALQTVATEFVNALKDPDSGLRSMITVIGYLGQAILTAGELIVSIFSQVKVAIWGAISSIQEGISGMGNVIWDVVHGRMDLIVDDAKKAGTNIKSVFKNTANDSVDVWKSFGNSVSKIWSSATAPTGPTKVAPKPTPIAGGVAGVAAATEKDIVAALVDKLKAQQEAEQKISNIIADSAYDLAIKKAAVEADNKIENTRNQLLERQTQLEKELVSASGTKKEAGIKAQLADVQRYLTELKTAAPQIRSLYIQMASEKEIAAANEALRKQTSQVDAEAAAFARLSAAAFGSAAAQREAAAQEAAAKYATENPELATQERLRVVYDNALKQQDLAYQKTVLQEAVQDDLNKKYEDEMTRLNDVRNALIANGKDTLVVDAQIYDAQRKVNMEWDDAAIKVGNFRQVMAGTLDKLSQQAESFSQTFSNSVIGAVNKSTDALTKFLVTGSKADFKAIGKDFEEQILGGAMKGGVSKIAGGLLGKLGLGGLLPGNAGKPDGTQSNPMYVSVVNSEALAGITGGGAGPAGGIGALLSGGMFSQGPAAPAGGGGGNFLSNILGSVFNFGGFLAEGGDVLPGKAYMVGEKRPELFMPDRPGKIVPDASKMKQAAGGLQANVTMHVHGASNPDDFRKSSNQITAELFRNMQLTHARNGGY
jgi:hypothetical protein